MIFRDYPPAVAWIVIAITLVTMAQFGSTEKLAAAFAWLIFIAVLMANGERAFTNLSGNPRGDEPLIVPPGAH